MATKKPAPVRYHGIVLALAAVLVWGGVSAVRSTVENPLVWPNDWIYGVVAIVFGSMVAGVAVNRIALHVRSTNKTQGTSAKTPKRKTT
jgi:TRAP-type C4-dicarboxylate transport system permease small subunit